jgi:hypothetical protein
VQGLPPNSRRSIRTLGQFVERLAGLDENRWVAAFRGDEDVQRKVRARPGRRLPHHLLDSKALPELEQAVSPNRRFEHVAVDDYARLAAVLDVKNCANIGCPVAGED